jgi:hypothetical protein
MKFEKNDVAIVFCGATVSAAPAGGTPATQK